MSALDAPPRVLMIDDSELAVEVQTMLLERHGFAVRACYELGTVDEELSAFRPHAILLDAHLGDATVEEAVLFLRELAPSVPVLLFSGMIEEELDALAGRLGVAGCISKSDDPKAVVAKLRAAVATTPAAP